MNSMLDDVLANEARKQNAASQPNEKIHATKISEIS
jgi:hypothetical protein